MIDFFQAWAQAQNHTVLPIEKALRLWVRAAGILKAGIPGDFAEFGVSRGGSAKLLSLVLDGSRGLHLYDTFTGIPAETCDPVRDRHRGGDFAANIAEVVKLLEPHPGVVFNVGKFDPTLVGDARLALVHVDSDTYASYKMALPRFWAQLSAGGEILLDDYGVETCPGATQATHEFVDATPGLTFIQSPAPHFGAILVKK